MERRLRSLALVIGVTGAAMLSSQNLAQAEELRVATFGGAAGKSEQEAYFKPFTAKTGVKVVEDEWNGDLAKVRAMVQSKSISWDIADTEPSEVIQGCEENLFEKIDWKVVGDRNNFMAGTTYECGVPEFVYSNIYAYDQTRITGKKPTTAADFFDTKTWPGKRGMRKIPKNTLEFALMADGVAPADVYKVLATKEGVDRAFKRLDGIKKDIVWWEAGAQPPQLLASGDVALTIAYNGRISDAIHKDGKKFAMVWDGQVYDLDVWAIVKGSPNKDLAMKFAAFASQPEVMAQQPKYISYGPTVKAALPLVDKTIAAELPTAPENLKKALQSNASFWADHNDELTRRFQTWLSQ